MSTLKKKKRVCNEELHLWKRKQQQGNWYKWKTPVSPPSSSDSDVDGRSTSHSSSITFTPQSSPASVTMSKASTLPIYDLSVSSPLSPVSQLPMQFCSSNVSSSNDQLDDYLYTLSPTSRISGSVKSSNMSSPSDQLNHTHQSISPLLASPQSSDGHLNRTPQSLPASPQSSNSLLNHPHQSVSPLPTSPQSSDGQLNGTPQSVSHYLPVLSRPIVS